MSSSKHLIFLFGLLLGIATIANGFNHGAALAAWQAYLAEFPGKSYTTSSELSYAQFYYNYNRNQINNHNALADRNSVTYRVAHNQFSDKRLTQFAALLPTAVYPSTSHNSTPVEASPTVPTEFNPIESLGLTVTVADQGTVCSSSWAYAAAKAIEILNAVQLGSQTPDELSAQCLIDCAGGGTGCSTQVPQMAFDYLTQYTDTKVLLLSDYPARITNSTSGMCVPSSTADGVQVSTYSSITDGDDTTLMKYVASGIPVIVEYNPATFGFMHYSSGVYQPPTTTTRLTGSQFLVVLGYGHDSTTNLDYWLCLNSFGTKWGENGYIRIIRSSTQSITKNAIFPNELV